MLGCVWTSCFRCVLITLSVRPFPLYRRCRRRLYGEDLSRATHAALTAVLVASPLPEATWYSAAESALTAIYSLHPAPEHLCGAVLKHSARLAFAEVAPAGAPAAEAVAAGDGGDGEAMDAEGPAAAGDEGDEEQGDEEQGEGQQAEAAASAARRSVYSVTAMSRFFFLLGHVSLQHLVSERMSASHWCCCCSAANSSIARC